MHSESASAAWRPIALSPSVLIIILTISLPDLFGLIEATSNPCVSAAVLLAFGAVEPGVVFCRPNRIGAATVSNPAATNNSFLLRSSLSATGSLHDSERSGP